MKIFIKKILKHLIGKKLLNKIFYENVPTLKSKDFKKWWLSYRDRGNIDNDLKLMVNDLILTDNFNNYSPYWNALAKDHIKLLSEKGIDNFKQTIEKLHYWGEGTVNSQLLKPIYDDRILISYENSELSKKHDFCEIEESKEYNKSNLILLNYLINNNYQKYLDKLDESSFGNPIVFNYKNKLYSFGLLNSILEIDTLEKNINLNEFNSVLEVGAGSGRTCSSLLKLRDNLNYTIVDIPPALYISQSNLINIFKNKKIFKYRYFNKFSDIEKDFISSDIKFLSPDQLKFIPKKFFDLSIAIDCLHEMKKIQVEWYFDEFDRLSKNLFFKCQNIQWATFEKNKYNIESYPVKNNWSKIIHEKCYIPNGYFQAIYKIN